MYEEDLLQRYQAALNGIDLRLLDKRHPEHMPHLAGLFVPSMPRHYADAQNKIMIIGRETRAWNVLGDGDTFTSLTDYLRMAVRKHRDFFEEQLQKTNSRGRSFHNFVRAVVARSGGDGIIYSNLFCFSWRKSKPNFKSDIFKQTIAPYSEALLKAQIDFFQPDIIIFATGSSSAIIRRQFFPTGVGGVCSQSRYYDGLSDGAISRGRLWEFKLYDKFRCFRINHPSSRYPEDDEARRFLLNLLPEHSVAV